MVGAWFKEGSVEIASMAYKIESTSISPNLENFVDASHRGHHTLNGSESLNLSLSGICDSRVSKGCSSFSPATYTWY